MNHIDLDRQFGELRTDRDGEEIARDSYFADYDFRPHVGWSNLLKEHLVVVLGEPGSGKSRELAHQHRLALARNEEAFLVPLERLVTESIDLIVDPAELQRFRAWRQGRATARFFLDSVDEAKLSTHSGFRTALDRLSKSIGVAALSRARFCISSRISEWLPGRDREVVLELLGGCLKEGIPEGPPTDNAHELEETILEDDEDAGEPVEGTKLAVFQLGPLDRERVIKFANAFGLSNPDRFVAAIDESFAWDFARRPLDVLDLMKFWRDTGRLGRLAEIIANDVRVKLRERDERRGIAVLSENEAIEGAQSLAAATVLCRRIAFKVPDDTVLAPGSLDAKECLPADWTPAHIGALLSRPLFDSAAYGRIRFHHRRAAEYLAAQWLVRRMELGCPVTALKDLLFSDIDGNLVLRPTAAPIAAWLCAGEERWQSDLQGWVLQTNPEIFFEDGDPGSLSVEYKRRLLSALVERYADREQVWISSSRDALRRFSDPALGDDLATLIRDRNIPNGLREQLLRIAAHGRLGQCVAAALEILGRSDESEDVKLEAVEVVRECNAADGKSRLHEIAATQTTISLRLCTAIVEALYPSAIRASELISLLGKVSSAPGIRVETHSLTTHLSECKPLPDAAQLLAELLNTLRTQPQDDEEDTTIAIVADKAWLLDVVLVVATAVLSQPQLTRKESQDVAAAMAIAGSSYPFNQRNHTELKSLERMTLPHCGVRIACLRNVVSRSQSSGKPKWTFVFGLTRDIPQWDWSRSDLDWLIDEIRTPSEIRDPEISLHIALHIWMSEGCAMADRRRIMQAVSGRRALGDVASKTFASARFARLRRLKATWGNREWRAGQQVQWIENLKQKFGRLQNRWFWLRRARLIRTGTRPDLLSYLCDYARDARHTKRSFNWDLLRKSVGSFVTNAARTGCKRAWRQFTPQLPHEKTDPASIDDRVDVGLAGIEAAIADNELSFEKLSPSEASLATIYAVNALGGFPSWFAALSSQQDGAVGDVLKRCITEEWKYPESRDRVNDVLSGLAWAGGAPARLARESVLECFCREDPPNSLILEQGLSLVLKVDRAVSPRLLATALIRCRELPVDHPKFRWWCAVAFQGDAQAAVAVLETRLRGHSDPTDVVSAVFTLLGERREQLPLVPNPDYRTPAALRVLIPFAFRYVRRQDDIDRGYSAYTPTRRDHAQSFRGELFQILHSSEAAEASSVLRELLREPCLASEHDWIRHLLDKRMKGDADGHAWEAIDIRTFEQEYETNPKTDADLFRIVGNRLDEIKHDVEASENSLREEMRKGDVEAVLRRWIARKLNERARGRYTVPQESEIDLELRPDIRAQNPRTDSVSMEVKWACRWSGNDLMERLENQLAGDYLRAHNSRFGIYIIGLIGDQREWRDGSGKRYSFPQFSELLRQRALELRRLHPGISGLNVVPIDFTTPTR